MESKRFFFSRGSNGEDGGKATCFFFVGWFEGSCKTTLNTPLFFFKKNVLYYVGFHRHRD